ncbi:MAG: esterase family protein [Verrucomicrobia bacterium]|nr:esterase family protein [Verrucomicrobiota bacterium]
MTTQIRLLTATLLLTVSAFAANAADDYKHGPDSQFNPNVPQGEVTKHSWNESKVFPGTTRDYWIYVPKQYDASKPARVMIFQDGGGYVRTNGEYRVPIVFDNLIARKELPVMIGVFINPGQTADAKAGDRPKNRSFEYDTLSDAYSRFLLEEIFPEVGKKYNLTTNASERAICGASSGGICAFTVAWERPDQFSKVLSSIGSFVNIRGGHVYPFVIRKTERKPIRVFLQDGSNDLDNAHGNWWLANQNMALALKFAGYDYQFVTGDGGHNGKHAGAIMPEALKWLWRDGSN